MRKYLYIILAAVVLLEIITLIIFRETLMNYVKDSISSIMALIITVVGIVALIIALINSFR